MSCTIFCLIRHLEQWILHAFSFWSKIIDTTQNLVVLDVRFEGFTVPYFLDFVGDDEVDLMLYLV